MLKTHDILYIVAGLLVVIGIIQQIFWQLRRRRQDRERRHFGDFEDHFRTLHSGSSTPHRMRSSSPTTNNWPPQPLSTIPPNTHADMCTSERAGSTGSSARVSTIQHPDPAATSPSASSRRGHASLGPHRFRTSGCSSRPHRHSRLGSSRVPERCCESTTAGFSPPRLHPSSSSGSLTSTSGAHQSGSSPVLSPPPSYDYSSSMFGASRTAYGGPSTHPSPPSTGNEHGPAPSMLDKQVRISGEAEKPVRAGQAELAPSGAPGRTYPSQAELVPSETPERVFNQHRIAHSVCNSSSSVVIPPPPVYSPPSVPL